ncbi:MAG: hypothetical protein ACRERV_01535 [Methylococcales bacterium]
MKRRHAFRPDAAELSCYCGWQIAGIRNTGGNRRMPSVASADSGNPGGNDDLAETFC